MKGNFWTNIHLLDFNQRDFQASTMWSLHGCKVKWSSIEAVVFLDNSGMNRGRGIFLIQSYDDIEKLKNKLATKETRSTSLPFSYIAQRYVVKPLLINKRKFDISQWVKSRFLSPPRCTRVSMVQSSKIFLVPDH